MHVECNASVKADISETAEDDFIIKGVVHESVIIKNLEAGFSLNMYKTDKEINIITKYLELKTFKVPIGEIEIKQGKIDNIERNIKKSEVLKSKVKMICKCIEIVNKIRINMDDAYEMAMHTAILITLVTNNSKKIKDKINKMWNKQNNDNFHVKYEKNIKNHIASGYKYKNKNNYKGIISSKIKQNNKLVNTMNHTLHNDNSEGKKTRRVSHRKIIISRICKKKVYKINMKPVVTNENRVNNMGAINEIYRKNKNKRNKNKKNNLNIKDSRSNMIKNNYCHNISVVNTLASNNIFLEMEKINMTCKCKIFKINSVNILTTTNLSTDNKSKIVKKYSIGSIKCKIKLNNN